MSWQLQEAKQRLSEVLRAVATDGPQTITRHGDEVAVIVGIEQYRQLTRPQRNLNKLLLGPPALTSVAVDVLDEIEAERKRDFPTEQDFGAAR